MEGETERIIRSFYCPSVGMLISSDGAECIGRNGIQIEQLFQPFSTLSGDITSRDITGQLHSGNLCKIMKKLKTQIFSSIIKKLECSLNSCVLK